MTMRTVVLEFTTTACAEDIWALTRATQGDGFIVSGDRNEDVVIPVSEIELGISEYFPPKYERTSDS